MPDEIVPQRCVLVLPSTGEFDSRTYRIARTLHTRGHQVEARRATALQAAHDTYNWESQVIALLDEHTRLTGRRW